MLERLAKDDPLGLARLVSAVLPKQIDQSVDVSLNVELLAEAKSFDQAYRLVLQGLRYIGADAEPELIESNGDGG